MPTFEARLRLHPHRALDVLREDRRLRRAVKRMPRPLPWDWALPRLMPLLVDYEASAAWPLMLDPFLLSEGQLFWRDLDDQDVWAPDIDIMMLSGQAS